MAKIRATKDEDGFRGWSFERRATAFYSNRRDTVPHLRKVESRRKNIPAAISWWKNNATFFRRDRY